jgi:ubiquinone/menaquinone biosynthesis C-methylase UbiE
MVEDGSGKGGNPVSYMDLSYEQRAAPLKHRLFSQLFPLDNAAECAVVLELGIGEFSNAPYYPQSLKQKINIIGIEPDFGRHPKAMAVAREHGLNLSILAAKAEALPFQNRSFDAVVSTCTLCTVDDAAKSLQEVKRVLKPGGRLLFWEHVLSETCIECAKQQVEASAEEYKRWGCRFDKRSLEEVKKAEFWKLVGIHKDFSDHSECYFELPNSGLMGPTAAGVATKKPVSDAT